MDFIKEITSRAKNGGLGLKFSGSKQTKKLYNLAVENPDKICIADNRKLFESLCSWYVQNVEGIFFQDGIDYTFGFSRGGYKILIRKRLGHVKMLLWKENKLNK